MKLATQIIHKIVRVSKTDFIFALIGKHFPILNKFIPLPDEYTLGEYRNVIRDGVHYRLDVSDYMQWSIYANQPDYSWQYGAKRRQQDNVIIDVGANVGQFCLKIANQLKRNKVKFEVHAFEPNRFIFSSLSVNLALNNDLKEHVHLYPMALGETEGSMNFSSSNNNSGGGRITIEPSERQVPVTTLDNWCNKQALSRVDFIKIDVEGYEPMVLLGGQEVIKKFKPDLYLEITEEWFRKGGFSSSWIFDLLQTWGYHYWIDADGRLEQPLTSRLIKSKQFNVLATTRMITD